MESLQGSWQYENFSSAKDVNPQSPPAPPSPTLYSLINYTPVVAPNKLGGDVLDYNQSINTFLVEGINSTSPFINDDGATSLLSSVSNTLGGIGSLSTAPARSQFNNKNVIGQTSNSFSFTNEIDDADLAWNDEESFNLEAFEELQDLDVAEVNNLLQDEVDPQSTGCSPLFLAAPVEPKINESSVSLNEPQEKSEPEKKSELLDQFHSILKNLEASNDTTIIDGEIIDISGIPALFNANELTELENEGIDLGMLSGGEDDMMELDDASNDSDGGSSSAGSYQSSIMDSQEIYLVTDETDSALNVYLEDSTSNPSQRSNFIVSFSAPSSVASSIDEEDDRQEMTLDALLGGDVDTAVALYPNAKVTVKQTRGNVKALNANPSSSNTSQGRSATVKAGLALQKPERRGRKPSTVAVGKPWVHVKDKALRKKEQNKTAATRYRQKKKFEAEVSMQQEQELTAEYDVMMKEKENLAKEISMVKNLLRAVFSAKKAQKKRR